MSKTEKFDEIKVSRFSCDTEAFKKFDDTKSMEENSSIDGASKKSEEYKTILLEELDKNLTLINEALKLATESHKTALDTQDTNRVKKLQHTIKVLIETFNAYIKSKDDVNNTSETVTKDSYKTGLHYIQMGRTTIQYLYDTIKQTDKIDDTNDTGKYRCVIS